MKPASSVVPLVALLAVACSEPTSTTIGALSASAQSAGASVAHRVSVGSSDQLPPGGDANFSLTAIQYGDGSVSGQWSDQFGLGNGGVHIAVNCVNVVGNQAWIGGVITASNGPVNLVGLPAITRVADLGQSQQEPEDQISFTFIGLAVTCLAAPNLPLVPVSNGQVTVR